TLLKRRRVERNRRVGRRYVHPPTVNDWIGVKRAHVSDLKHSDRPNSTNVLPIDLLQVYKALASVVVVRQKPVCSICLRAIEFRLSRFCGRCRGNGLGQRSLCRFGLRLRGRKLGHDLRLLEDRRIGGQRSSARLIAVACEDKGYDVDVLLVGERAGFLVGHLGFSDVVQIIDAVFAFTPLRHEALSDKRGGGCALEALPVTRSALPRIQPLSAVGLRLGVDPLSRPRRLSTRRKCFRRQKRERESDASKNQNRAECATPSRIGERFVCVHHSPQRQFVGGPVIRGLRAYARRKKYLFGITRPPLPAE